MPSTMKTPAAISPKEVAEGLSMSRRQVYRWIDNEELPTNQIDGYHKITEGQLAEKIGKEMAEEVFRRVAEAEDE